MKTLLTIMVATLVMTFASVGMASNNVKCSHRSPDGIRANTNPEKTVKSVRKAPVKAAKGTR